MGTEGSNNERFAEHLWAAMRIELQIEMSVQAEHGTTSSLVTFFLCIRRIFVIDRSDCL